MTGLSQFACRTGENMAYIAPIQYIGEAHVSNAAGGVAGNQVCNVPAGVQNGDFLVGFVYKAQDSVHTLTAPGGWTNWTAVNLTEINSSVWHRVANSEPANYTWTVSATGIWGVCIMAFRGVDQESPFTNLNTSNATTTNPISTPSLDAIHPGNVYLSMIADATSTVTEETHTINTGTEIVDWGFDGGVSSRNGAAYYSPTIETPTNAVSYSITGASGTLTRRIVFGIVLHPYTRVERLCSVGQSVMNSSVW